MLATTFYFTSFKSFDYGCCIAIVTLVERRGFALPKLRVLALHLPGVYPIDCNLRCRHAG
jgi:hypothetical protein